MPSHLFHNEWLSDISSKPHLVQLEFFSSCPHMEEENKAREEQSRETWNFHNHLKLTLEASSAKTNEFPWPSLWLQLHITIPVQHSHTSTVKLIKFGLQPSSYISVLRTFVLALKQQEGEEDLNFKWQQRYVTLKDHKNRSIKSIFMQLAKFNK